MAVDFLYSHSLMQAEVVQGVAPIWIRWYPCAAGARSLGQWTVFGHPVWDGLDERPDVRPAVHPRPMVWAGKTYPAPPGTHSHGQAQWWLTGLPASEYSQPTDPADCRVQPIHALGGIIIGGHGRIVGGVFGGLEVGGLVGIAGGVEVSGHLPLVSGGVEVSGTGTATQQGGVEVSGRPLVGYQGGVQVSGIVAVSGGVEVSGTGTATQQGTGGVEVSGRPLVGYQGGVQVSGHLPLVSGGVEVSGTGTATQQGTGGVEVSGRPLVGYQGGVQVSGIVAVSGGVEVSGTGTATQQGGVEVSGRTEETEAVWTRYNKVWTDAAGSGSTIEVPLVTLAAGEVIHGVILWLTDEWEAPLLLAASGDVVTSGGTSLLTGGLVLNQPSSGTTFVAATGADLAGRPQPLDLSTTVDVVLRVDLTGAVGDDLTAGSATVWLQTSMLP